MDLEVRVTESKGRGVFALRTFNAGDIIERCELIVVPLEHLEHLKKTKLFEYYFQWNTSAAIALGMGSLYNHSDAPNAEYIRDYRQEQLVFRAVQSIHKNEEVTVKYSNGRVWFTPK